MSSRGEVAQVSYGRVIQLWDTAGTPRGIGVVRGKAGAIDAGWSPDGATLALPMDDGTVQLWSRTLTLESTIPAMPGTQATAVAFSPDGATVAVTLWKSSGSKVAFYSVRTHRRLGAPVPVLPGVGTVTWSPNGRTVVIGSWSVDGFDVVDVAGHRVRTYIPTGFLIQARSPDKRWLAVGDLHGWVNLIDPATGAMAYDYHPQQGPVNSVSFSPDGRWLASAAADGTVVLINPSEHKILGPVARGLGQRATAKFSPSGRLIVQSTDGTLRSLKLGPNA